MAVGRFQVMALLQAARAHVLGLPLESAYSWGLNRAIFIAAAKRGFKGGPPGRTGESEKRTPKTGRISKEADVYYLGDDMAYTSRTGGILRFTIGGEIQTREKFDKQVRSRFGQTFPAAWDEAVSYVKGFDKETLLSAESFFREVYKPKRDELAEKWTRASSSEMKLEP